MKWFDKPGRVPGLIFRRTYTELKDSGGLWEEACKLYPRLGAEMIESKLTARFPSGYKVLFRHMQHDKDARAWNGKNLGDVAFDEGTFFTEFMFWQMISCMRAAGNPRFRLTCNPDPDSWVFAFIEWYLTPVGVPDPLKSGKIRWFGRKDGKLMWFNSQAEACAAGVPDAMSFTFIASKLDDNPALMAQSPRYGQNLMSLPPLERARYADGNWRIRAKAGSYFQSAWFPRISSNPLERSALPPIKRWFWCMDLASTPVEGDQVPGAPVEVAPPDKDPKAKKSPDWTIILLMAQLVDGRLVVWDVWRYRDTSGAIEWKMVELAKQYKVQTKHCMTVQWQDPAQAGVHQNTTYARALREHSRLATTPSINPELVARLAGRAAYRGQIIIRDAAMQRDAFLHALEGYPTAEHDDDVSALGLAVVYALENPALIVTGARDAAPEQGDALLQEIRGDIQINARFREY